MPRARIIKPSFFLNEQLFDLSPWHRLLFIGLWTLADRAGICRDRPRQITASLFPADQLDVDALLTDLDRQQLITRYTVNGEAYLEILTFTKHQHPHPKEPESGYPASTCQDAVKKNGRPRKATAGRVKVMSDPSGSSSPSSPSGSSFTRQSRKTSTDDAAFALFWTAYPKKVGKDDAEKVWNQRCLGVSQGPDILAALERQRAWMMREGGLYIPNPATWLRQGRWKDTPPPILGSLQAVDLCDPLRDAIVKAGPSKRPYESE